MKFFKQQHVLLLLEMVKRRKLHLQFFSGAFGHVRTDEWNFHACNWHFVVQGCKKFGESEDFVI